MLRVKYPVSIANNNNRYCYLYRLQELLKLEHNSMGEKFRNEEITPLEWEQYKETFNKKSSLISNEILKYRALMKNNVSSAAKLSDIA